MLGGVVKALISAHPPDHSGWNPVRNRLSSKAHSALRSRTAIAKLTRRWIVYP